jgi:hypothetical protein
MAYSVDTTDPAVPIITQTGTDSDISGLSGLAGVTTTSIAGNRSRKIYNIGINRFVIQGTLTLNAGQEVLYCPRSTVSGGILHLDGGTFTINDSLSLYGGISYNKNTAIHFTDTGGYPWSNGYGAMHFESGSFVMNGGRIYCAAGIRWQNSLTTFEVNNGIFDGNLNGSGESVWFCTAALDKFNINGWELVGGKFEFSGNNFNAVAFNGVRYQSSDKGFSTGGGPNGVNDFWPIFNYSGIDMKQDFSVWSGRKARFYNSPSVAVGVNGQGNGNSRGIAEEVYRLRFKINDNANSPISGVKYYSVDVDNGSRVDYLSQDYLNDRVYSGTNDAAGQFQEDYLVATTVIDTNRQDVVGGQPKDVRYTDRIIDIRAIEYSKEILLINYDAGVYSGSESIIDQTVKMISDLFITEQNKSTVDAYTDIETSKKLYDRAKSFLSDNFLGESAAIVLINGQDINAGTYDIDIDATASVAFAFNGSKLTIKASTFSGNMTTSGVIALLNGAAFNGSRTDANGTIAPAVTYNLQLANILVGSRYQVYNVTASTEITNALVTSGGINNTYTKDTDYTAGDVGRYRITYQSGVNAKEAIEGVFTFPSDSTINSLPTAQLSNGSYETFAIDGSSISEFSWDSGNVEVNINDADNSTSIQRFGAWYYYFITTEIGIDQAFGAVLWETLNSIQIYSSIVNIKLDNTKASPLILDGGRIYRNDGSTIIAATSNSIQVDYSPVYMIETGVSGLTASESQKINNLDVAVSTRAVKADVDQALVDYNVDTKTNVKPSIGI